MKMFVKILAVGLAAGAISQTWNLQASTMKGCNAFKAEIMEDYVRKFKIILSKRSFREQIVLLANQGDVNAQDVLQIMNELDQVEETLQSVEPGP